MSIDCPESFNGAEDLNTDTESQAVEKKENEPEIKEMEVSMFNYDMKAKKGLGYTNEKIKVIVREVEKYTKDTIAYIGINDMQALYNKKNNRFVTIDVTGKVGGTNIQRLQEEEAQLRQMEGKREEMAKKEMGAAERFGK